MLGLNTVTAQNDFRSVNWGMSSLEVKANETSKLLKEDKKRIIYECPLYGMKGKLNYVFTTSGKLMRSKYYLAPEYINTKFYVRDYNMFLDILTQKYGQPAKKLITNNEGKDTVAESEWPVYLAAGELRVEITWNVPKTDICLTLTKVGETLAIQIDYISTEINAVDLQEKKEKMAKFL